MNPDWELFDDSTILYEFLKLFSWRQFFGVNIGKIGTTNGVEFLITVHFYWKLLYGSIICR